MNAPTPDLVVFSRCDTAPEALEPAPEQVLSGRPAQSVRNHYSDAAGRFHAGEWTCEPGCWKVRYAEQEFCHLLEGEVELATEDGRRWRLRAGDAFVIPAGFAGTWETLTRCRKYYVILEPERG